MEKIEERTAISAQERKGPFLSAALIAERVLEESDRTQTFVRVIDMCVLSAETSGKLKKDELVDFSPMRIALIFKAWGYEGNPHVLIIQGGPSGDSRPLGMNEIPFDGTLGRSYTMYAPVVISWEGYGFYWFDIQLDNKFVTRIPFQVKSPSEAGEDKQ